MTDAELIARLREMDGWVMHGARTHLAAADRIEELEAKLKTSEEIGKAFEEDAGQLRAKLAKAVEALEYYAVEAMPWDADDSLIARTALAEIKGESHE